VLTDVHGQDPFLLSWKERDSHQLPGEVSPLHGLKDGLDPLGTLRMPCRGVVACKYAIENDSIFFRK